MKKIFITIITIFFSLLSINLEAQKRVIVLPLSGDSEDLVTERFTIELQKTKAYKIIERSELNKLRNELKFQSSDLFDESKMLEIGKFAKAELVMIGAVSGISGNVTIAVRAVDILTGIIAISKKEDINLDNHNDLSKFAKAIASESDNIDKRINDSRILSAVLPFNISISQEKIRSSQNPQKYDNSHFYSFLPFGLGSLINSSNNTTTSRSKRNITDSELLTNIFMNGLFNSQNYKFVERANLNKIIDEMKFQENDEFDDSQAMEIGKQSGVKLIFIGKIKETGDEYLITVKGIEVNTGMVEVSEYIMAYSIDDIVPKTIELANLLLGKKSSTPKFVQKKNPNLWVKKSWGISPTDHEAMRNHYRLHLKVASSLLGSGIAFVVVGGLFAIFGGLYYGDYMTEYEDINYSRSYTDQDIGIALLIVGGVFGGTGLLLALFSAIPFLIADSIKRTYYKATGNNLVLKNISLDYDINEKKLLLATTLTF